MDLLSYRSYYKSKGIIITNLFHDNLPSLQDTWIYEIEKSTDLLLTVYPHKIYKTRQKAYYKT